MNGGLLESLERMEEWQRGGGVRVVVCGDSQEEESQEVRKSDGPNGIGFRGTGSAA